MEYSGRTPLTGQPEVMTRPSKYVRGQPEVITQPVKYATEQSGGNVSQYYVKDFIRSLT